jgi:flagellar biosynthesis/type III secretory pathway protein FliH
MDRYDISGEDESFQEGYKLGHAHGSVELSRMRDQAQFLAQQLYAERQKVRDLQELLDRTRQIALDLDQKVMRGKA